MKHTIEDWEDKRAYHEKMIKDVTALDQVFPDIKAKETIELHTKYAFMCQEVIDMLKNEESEEF